MEKQYETLSLYLTRIVMVIHCLLIKEALRNPDYTSFERTRHKLSPLTITKVNLAINYSVYIQCMH